VPTALIAIEGVLRDSSGLPISEGVRLLSAISSAYRVALASRDVDDDALWLQIEGIRDHQEIVEDTPGYLRGQDHRLSQIDHLLGRGQEVTLVVDPDPGKVALVMHKGIVGVLFGHPKFSRPEYRPDHQHVVRPWDEMVAEIETQKVLEANLEPPTQ
jgi:hypothetical protein